MSILFRVATLTGAVFMAACSGAKESSTQSELPPQPPMWVVSDADSEITLYPTIHILPDGVNWKSEAMTKRLADAEEVWFEIPPGAELDPAIQLSTMQLGMAPGSSLSSKLTEEEVAKLKEVIAPLGMPFEAVDAMKPWLASTMVSVAALVGNGFNPEAGVEKQLEPLAAGKTIRGLETAQQQIEMLAGLPEDAQLQMLKDTLSELDEMVETLNEMVEDWSVGDVDDLEDEFIDEMKSEMPAVYEAIVKNRNIDWANQIEEELKGSGTDFIAVGAAHLVGDDSVQAILKARGITVKRL